MSFGIAAWLLNYWVDDGEKGFMQGYSTLGTDDAFTH